MDAADLPEEVQLVCASFLHAMNTSAEGLVEALWLRGSLAWGEYHPESDVDFTAVLAHPAGPHDLAALEAAHTQIWFEHPQCDFNGHHVQLADLQRPAAQCPPVPCVTRGHFEPEGSTGVNPLAWSELATHGLRIAGREPGVLGLHHDPTELSAHARTLLETEWTRAAKELRVSWLVAGRRDDVVSQGVLGVARLHHVAHTGTPVSKDGAGRHVLEELDERWHPLARDALRIRARPDERSEYRSLAQRGKDLRDFVAWCVADARLPDPEGGDRG